jgi:predicted cobalt transporter CbtA
MRQGSLRSILLAALLAGVLGGLMAGLFHLWATEPILQQAIDIEHQQRQIKGTAAEPEMVSRSVQHIGLIVGFLLYGVIWGGLFGLVYWYVARRTTAWRPIRQGLGLALTGYWTLGIFPQLKYPANPPGVGEAATISYRQELYFSFLGLSLLGAALGAIMYRDLGRVRGVAHWATVRTALVLLVYALYAATVSLLLPDNPDPVSMPGSLVAQFRWLSVAGTTVFWLVLGASFVLLLRCWTRDASYLTR